MLRLVKMEDEMNLERGRKRKLKIVGLVLAAFVLTGCGGKPNAAVPVTGTDSAEILSDVAEGTGALGEGVDLAESDSVFGAVDTADSLSSFGEEGGIDSLGDTSFAKLSDTGPGITQPENIPEFDSFDGGGGGSFDVDGADSRGILANDPGTLVAGPAMYTPNPKTAAALDAINYAEGKPNANQTYGYQNFTTPGSGHPRKLVCQNHCSDAAGEYQIQSPTYDTYARRAGVSGFSKPEQEQLAEYLMKDVRGANPDNIHDYSSFTREFGKLCREWASVPCSNGQGAYGQPIKTMPQLYGEYQKSLNGRS